MASMNTHELIETFAATLRRAGVPIKNHDNSQLLAALEQRPPKRLPQSLEHLLSHFSFPAFDVGGISLFAWDDPSAENEWFAVASARKGSLSEVLLPHGYFQIGRPDSGIFDAICVDLNTKAQNREHRIVRAGHEEVLCNWRVRITETLRPSFRALAEHAIAEASSIHYRIGSESIGYPVAVALNGTALMWVLAYLHEPTTLRSIHHRRLQQGR